MELWFWKFTFGVGFLACCFVDLSCWGRPIYSGDEAVLRDVEGEAAVPLVANLGVIVVSVIGVVCIVLVLVGCLCCQKGVFKTFESLHNGRFRQGYVSQTSNEFTMFPPGGSSGQQRGSMADIKFEPLPDIRPRGRSLPTAQRPRPATFSNVINRGLSVQDWFDDPHINFPRYQLQYLQELGSGWFGKVVEGEANGIGISPQKTKVVVKILREDATPTDQMYFLHEVKAFRDLSHPNIMKLLGKCLESDPFLIILEHCAFKDLKTYLTQHRTESESLIQGNLLLRMACNIAAGLHHMHAHGFIHTDLAARNCLVNADLQVKIGDYGNAIEKFRENYYCAGDVAVPIRWCAPESLRCTEMTIETKEVTKEANIWSFGVVLWEIIEFGKLPYFELNDDDVLQKVIIDNSTTLAQPRTAVAHKDRVYEVMKLCWLSEPQLRPNMEKVSAMLAHLHNHKDPDLSSEFEHRWNSLQPRVTPHPTRIGAGDGSTNLTFESDFAASSVAAPRRSRDWDTSSSMSPVYSLSLEGDFPGTNGSTISPSLQNLRGSMDDLNAASSSSIGGGRFLVEQTSVSEGDLNEGGLTHESTPDLKTRSASEDLLQQRRSEEHSPRKVQREFDAWLQQQQSQGAEASHMAQQISEAIGDLDQALASEKSSESSSHHASPERDETLPYEGKDEPDDMDVDEEEAERRWTEMVDGTTREAAQVTELVREKSQSVQDFLKLTVIDSDNSDSDINTPRQPPPSSSLPLEDEGVLHNIPSSKLTAFATEVAGASVTAAVREASSPTPRSEIVPSPLLVVATGAVSLIPAEAALAGAEMLNGGQGVYSFNPRNDLVSETEQSPVLPFLSSVADANDRPPFTNIPVVKEASLTSSQVMTPQLDVDKQHQSVECEQIPSTDASALHDFRLVLNDVATKDLLPAVVSSDVSSEDNLTATKLTSSTTSALPEDDVDGSSPHEITDVSSTDDFHSHLGCVASTPLHIIDEPDLSAYFAIRTSDDQSSESPVDDLWAAEGMATSRENVALEDVALIVDSSSSWSSDPQNHLNPLTYSALELDTGGTHNKDNIVLQVDTEPPSSNQSPASGDDCTDGAHHETATKAESLFTTAFDDTLKLTNTLQQTSECNLDEETGERSRFQSLHEPDGFVHKNLPEPKTNESLITAAGRDVASPTGLDSGSSSATMYLTCDDSTQSSQYRTDSDNSATTMEDSSSIECAIDSVKEIIRPKRFAYFDGEGTNQAETTADTIESDSESAVNSEDKTDVVPTAEGSVHNVAVTSIARIQDVVDNSVSLSSSCITTDSDCVANNNFNESSMKEESLLTSRYSASDHDGMDKSPEMKRGVEEDCRAETNDPSPTTDHHDDFEDFLSDHHSDIENLMSMSNNVAVEEDITAELPESFLLCETVSSPPSDDLHALINCSDIPGEADVLIALGDGPEDHSATNGEQNDFVSDSDICLQPAGNLEDYLEATNSRPVSHSKDLFKTCDGSSENDSTIFTTALHLDKKQGNDNETMGLAADENSLDFKLKTKHDIYGTKSDHSQLLSEEECVLVSGGVNNNDQPLMQEDDGVEFLHSLIDETLVKEDVTSSSNAVAECTNSRVVDTSSEEEGPQEEARDSLSDGTFERAATPLIEDAFTLDPVIPLEVSENSTEDETSVKSSIPELKSSSALNTEVIKSGQGSSKLEDDSVVMSPSDTELDVMSGDAETVEFEFFVSADGDGNANLQSVPCITKNTTLFHADKMGPGIVDVSEESEQTNFKNTFVKFDSDITPENCSDYGTNVEASNDQCMPVVAASNNISNDDEKHSEGSESSGLSTLYEIEDIEEALADVDSSEDDSPQIGGINKLEGTNEISPTAIQLTKAAFTEDDFDDFEYPDSEQTADSLSDWNGNNPLISTWHHNGLHNFVPLHSTIEEVSEEEETISGLADAFQHAFTRIVRRLSEVEMEMVSDENESAVLGITPSPVKELALSAEALKAVKGGSNGSALIHDAVNEAMVSCVADILDNNVVLDDRKPLNIDLKLHELTKDSSPVTIPAKSQDNVVLNNNCRNSVLNRDENRFANEDVVNANTDILDLSANVANDDLDNITGVVDKVHYNDDCTNINRCNTKSETLPESLNSVTIEDLDVPRNGIEKVTFCPASRDDEDDVLIVDTETNEVTLLESNRPRPHLAFVRQSVADTLPFQAKISSDGEESESEMSSSAAEETSTSQSKVVGSRFVVVPCIHTGIVIDEELEASSPSFEDGSIVKSAVDLPTTLTPLMSDSTHDVQTSCEYSSLPNSDKVDTEVLVDIGCKNEEKYEISMERNVEAENEGCEIAHSLALLQKDDDEAQVVVSSPVNDECTKKYGLAEGEADNNSDLASETTVISSELPITSVVKDEPNVNCDEILNEEIKLEVDIPATMGIKTSDGEADSASLEAILKFASMSTVEHETETIAATESKAANAELSSSNDEKVKATEGIILDVMESDPEDELVALIPVCADSSEVSPSLRPADDAKRDAATPDVCYTPDWESDTDTSSSQSSSSTSGEFEVNKSTKPSDASEEFMYSPLTNIHERKLEDGDDDHSDDELDAETRAALEAFQPSEWNKNATPSRGLLRSPEKKSEGKKCVSFKMQKRQVIYEYPKEDKSWDNEHASSRSSWSDQVYDPQTDFTNSIDWELGDEEIPEDIVEVEDFDDCSNSYDPAPVFRLHDDALYRLSNINYEDDACDGGRSGGQSNGDAGGEVVMYDPESGGLTFQQLLEHYGNNPELFGSPPEGEELWPGATLQDSNFFVNCSSDDEDPFKMDPQQFYNAHYFPHYFMDPSHNYFSADGSEPDPRASEGDDAYLGTPESDYMLHRFGPAAAGFHYYDPVMGVNMFVGNGENDESDFAEALDRMIQKEQNGVSHGDVEHDGNNGDDSDSDEIPSFEVKPQKSKAICDTNGLHSATTETPNELESRNEIGEHSNRSINGFADNAEHSSEVEVSSTSSDRINGKLSPHGTDSGLGTPSIEEMPSSPSIMATASSSSVSLDTSRTYPAAVELSNQELFI